MIFETERFIVRRFVDDDAEDAFTLYGDPEVLRYLGAGNEPPHRDVEHTRTSLARATEHFEKRGDGLGLWAVEERVTERVVGAVGLNELATGEIEVFYQLPRAQWGRGIATETARGAIKYAFDRLKLERIVAIAYAENTASLNVIRKLGMRYEGPREFFGKQLEYFVIERDRPGTQRSPVARGSSS